MARYNTENKTICIPAYVKLRAPDKAGGLPMIIILDTSEGKSSLMYNV